MVDFQSRDTRRRSTDGTDATGDGDADDRDASDDAGRPDGDAPATEESRRDDPETGLRAAVLTVSDAVTHRDDPWGDAVAEALAAAGHEVAVREVLRASHDTVQQTVDTLVDRRDVDAVVTAGGVGVAPDDVTVEAVRPLVGKGLPGFGELFRRRYADAVGTDAVATRATAGIVDGTPVFCLPGDADGAALGTREIVAEQAPRLVARATGTGTGAEAETRTDAAGE